jgi:deoxyribodipyrimidine photolyase-related protein
MTEATIIYPHQLFKEHPAIALGRPIFIIEEPLLLSEFPTHRQKLLLHRLSTQTYAAELREAGHSVTILEWSTKRTTADIFSWLATHHFTTVHIVDTTDDWLEQRITDTCATHSLTRIWYESPLFLLAKAEAIQRYTQSRKNLGRFYEQYRRDTGILMTKDGTPKGGQFNFDAENRKKLPKDFVSPSDPTTYSNPDTQAARAWLSQVTGEQYGSTDVWLPYTHAGAAAWLDDFIRERFAFFGPYEDAISTEHTRLFHSVLSPLLNIGLLTPGQIVTPLLTAAEAHEIPLPSLEGFIRQIIGWREFIRASYEADGRHMRTQNFWQHTRKLPDSWWNGTTGITPLDTSITRALAYGYTHHIERLMVAGNFMLLSEIHPDDVYRWFMGMYVDAYDWVMVPNVYGMSQFADGGSFATKPYISGSNYILKMSDYTRGDWTSVWDGLYWNFIHTNAAFFSRNHRLSMMPRLLEKMPESTRKQHLNTARRYLDSLA